jgi:hypothetical protein
MKNEFWVFQHSDKEACPIGFCERLCVELTTDLEETKLQVLFLPVNVYVEDSIVVSRSKNIIKKVIAITCSREIKLINIYLLEVFNYLV